VESYDEQGFQLVTGTCVEVLTLVVEFDVKDTLGQTVDFDLFNFAIR
jgi:hypothetical protein